jgi:L-lactate dehydrogenase (cytochrome)
MDEMLQAALPNQVQWFQVYVNANRGLTRSIIEKAQENGVKAICVTVDAPQLGRREKDMRVGLYHSFRAPSLMQSLYSAGEI